MTAPAATGDWPIRTTLTPDPSSSPHDAVERWRLTVGPLDLWARAGDAEVEVLWTLTGDEGRRMDVGWSLPPEEVPRGQRLRIAVREPTLRIVPCCAPRPVVARAERPIRVGPGRVLRAWVSTPLWLRVETDAGPGPELPAQPVKHTWAGPTTEGHLCVATRTLLRLNLDNVAQRDHRILSTVELHNQHDEALTVERVALPMPMARLYATERGLWSETLRLVHRGERTDADPVGPPREAHATGLVGEARAPGERNPLKNVFGAVMGVVP